MLQFLKPILVVIVVASLAALVIQQTHGVLAQSAPTTKPSDPSAKPARGGDAPVTSDAAQPAATMPSTNQQSNQWAAPLEMDQEMMLQCVGVANDIDPELGDQLASKRQKNPEEFSQQLQQDHVGRRLWAMVQLKQRDPDLYKLKISEITQQLHINRVTAQLQQAMLGDDAGKTKALREQLRNLLQIQFAMSLKARAEYLCRIEEQVMALREEIDHDAAHFHQIVEARMKQLVDHPVSTDPAAVIPTSNRLQRPAEQAPVRPINAASPPAPTPAPTGVEPKPR